MFESFTNKPIASDAAPQSTTSHLPQTGRHHPCPSYRTCWPGLTMASFSPINPPTRAHLYRRLSMIVILGLDTFVSILSILSHSFGFSIIPRILIAVLHFLCAAWFLHCIGRMYGERTVFHKVFVRRDFDIFLGGLVVVELGLVLWYFAGLTHKTAGAWWGLDIAELLALWGVGWVAWWGPLETQQGQPETMVV